MGTNLSKPLSKLSKRGPHRVLVGDLAYAGLEGKLYVPEKGNGIPGVVFAHDWHKSIDKYHGTLKHLASWGIAVAAPNTETGFFPDHRGFAADLESALQILTGVKLGNGNVTVSPGRIGLVGHGMGASCAVIAAAERDNLGAVAALFPSRTHPKAEDLAASVSAPGLVIGGTEWSFLDYGNAAKLADQWGSEEVAYREFEDANHHVLTEDVVFKLLTGLGGIKMGQREALRGMTVGFLLGTIGGEKKYADFADPEAESKKMHAIFGEDLQSRVNPADEVQAK